MAAQQTHITFSFILALVYAFFGGAILAIGGEQVLLGAVLVMIAGMLPNVDAGGEPPARELTSLLAAIAPILILHFSTWAAGGGVSRIALIVICCYLIARIIIVRFILKNVRKRGIMHSLPLVVITGEACYLLFNDLAVFDRVYLAIGAASSYLSHLLIDAYGNLDLVGKAMGKSEKKPGVLSLFGDSLWINIFVYAAIVVMAWMIAKDFYPGLRIEAGISL